MDRSFAEIRKEFPAVEQEVNGQSLVYLDSAASALKPRAVIDRLHRFYSLETSNVHRGIHTLSAQATDAFEQSRVAVQNFIGATTDEEIIFTKGTTESINLVASTWGRSQLKEGDVIVLSEMEHHSNLVPWHMLAKEKNLQIRIIGVTDQGELKSEDIDLAFQGPVAFVALSHCSNTLGTINDVQPIIEKAHAAGAKVLLDAAQSVTFMPIDVQKLNCDFLVFSGHKLFGPYGIGVLYGKKDCLDQMPPYQGGGAMISQVELKSSTFNDPPFRFEAGTPNISGVIGLKAAIDFVNQIGMENIRAYEEKVSALAFEKLKQVNGLRMIGESSQRAPIFSFVIDGTHANDIGEIVDQKGVAVRTGHHCTQPLMQRFSVPATVRASFSIYNTESEIDKLVEAVETATRMLT